MKKESALIATFETEEGTTKVYDSGLVESLINDGAYLDVQYLLDGKAALLKLNLAKKFYVVTQGTGFYRITKDARQLSASRTYSDHLAAVAVIVGRVSTKLILELYLKIDKPVVPTKAFTHPETAFEWLRQMKEAEVAKVILNPQDDADPRISP